MTIEFFDLKDVRDTLKRIVDFLELGENKEAEQGDAARMPSYKERTLDKFIKQLREIYTKVKIVSSNDYNQSDFEEWLWQYRKTALWNLLRVLPSVIKIELEIEYNQPTLDFWRTSTGEFVLILNITLEQSASIEYKEKIEREIMMVIEHQKLPHNCNIAVEVY